MAKNITITNGVGSSAITNGSYSVTVESTGYDASSILPSSVTVVEGTNDYQFTVAGTGTLTIHVTEDETSTGTPVVGAKFKRADSAGNLYGDEVTTDSTGNALLEHLPFDASNAPNVYFKQISSDGSHEFSGDLITITLTSATQTKEIRNTLATVRNITLTDANYSNLPIENATITLN